MLHHLQEDIFTNDTNYFFSLLGPRFDYAVQLMAEALQKRFNAPFSPIYVYSARPNKHFARENYIVLNAQADKIEDSSHDKVIYLQEFEDLNLEFVKSEFVKDLGAKLLTKQDKLFVYPFTTSFLDIEEPNWIIIGPDPAVVKRFDNKVDQYELFTDLDLPRNRASIFSSSTSLEESILYGLPCYVTASYASGGNESGLVYSPDMLHKIISGLRTANKQDRFLVSEVFDGLMIAPNASGIVTDENKTQVLIISDQILAGTRYLGNVYPSAVSPEVSQKIQAIMKVVGNKLSTLGFRGFFGCDFLVSSEGRLATVDLNPRRQGGYLCNVLSLKAVGVDLISIELDCAVDGRSTMELDYSQIQYPRVWAHSKAKPYGPGQRVCADMLHNSVEKIFESETPQSYAATFYESGCMFLDGYIGYVITTGYDRTEVLRELRRQGTKLLSASLQSVAAATEPVTDSGKTVDTVSGTDFRGADLRGVDLRGIYLRGANLLREADLREVDLSGKDLSGADLSGAKLVGANLEAADLSGANLENAHLQGVNFRKANLQGAKLDNAQLMGVDLCEANLANASLKSTRLQGANISLANLKEANLSLAILDEATLRDAKLPRAVLLAANLSQVNLKGALLEGADLQAAHLEGAKLNNINLAGANLSRAYLQGANLTGADLRGANISDANLSGADLYQAQLDNANLSNANLERANLRNTQLRQTNLEQAILCGACIVGANLAHANLKKADLVRADLESACLEGANLDQVELALANLQGTGLKV